VLLGLALAALGGCGNYSNEDLAFYAALPRKELLEIHPPVDSATHAVCNAASGGDAKIWTDGKGVRDGINKGIGDILGLVDAVTKISPTTRDPDKRTWGPWDDTAHKGIQDRITMTRIATGHFQYAFAARRSPGDFIPIIEGDFIGASAEQSHGTLSIHFSAAQQLQIANPGDPPGDIVVRYDLVAEPRIVELDLTAATGFGLARFDYSFAGYDDGHGRFDYSLDDGKGNHLEIAAWFTGKGAGRADVSFRDLLGTTGKFTECWDELACGTFVDNPQGFPDVCGGATSCGKQASCPVF
jgi:hypothetical protein